LTPSPAFAAPSPKAPPTAHDAIEVPALLRQPEQAAAPRPASRRAAETVLAAIAIPPAAAVKAAPEPPAAPAAQPADSVGGVPAAVIPPVKPALRQEEIAMMVERGRVLFEAGDLASARLFFRRAANAGDAAAAIAMGATYDPEVLAQRFIRGIEADAQEAQRWYERAREMGRRVEMVAQRR
jgi:TPR repeat protein